MFAARCTVGISARPDGSSHTNLPYLRYERKRLGSSGIGPTLPTWAGVPSRQLSGGTPVVLPAEARRQPTTRCRPSPDRNPAMQHPFPSARCAGLCAGKAASPTAAGEVRKRRRAFIRLVAGDGDMAACSVRAAAGAGCGALRMILGVSSDRIAEGPQVQAGRRPTRLGSEPA